MKNATRYEISPPRGINLQPGMKKDRGLVPGIGIDASSRNPFFAHRVLNNTTERMLPRCFNNAITVHFFSRGIPLKKEKEKVIPLESF